MQRLQKFDASWFRRTPLRVARDLLGMKLVTRRDGITTSGMIVEVEAYSGSDPASHSFPGPTKRNEVMFREGGHCYVYLIYGMYHCVNVVTGREGHGAAVLIRAIEPLEGAAHMQRRRKLARLQSLANGPGRVCQALGIDFNMQGEYLLKSPLIHLEPYRSFAAAEVKRGPRIGITKAVDKKWRLYLKNSPWVSRS